MIDPLQMVGRAEANQATSGALFQAMGENQLWLAMSQNDTALPMKPTSGTLPRIGIDGAGLLVLDDRGCRVFARFANVHAGSDGFLRDENGALLLGYPPAGDLQAQATRTPAPLRVPKNHEGNLLRFDIDESGHVLTWSVAVPGKPMDGQEVEIGRLAAAIFASPKDLQGPDARLTATAASSAPIYLPSDAPHVGSVRRNLQSPSVETVHANLRELWNAAGRAEIDVALASSADALERTALNIVR